VIVVKDANRAPTPIEITIDPINEGSAALEFLVSKLASDDIEDQLSFVAGSVKSSNEAVATVAIVDEKLIIKPVEDVVKDSRTRITAVVTDDKGKTTKITLVIVVKNVEKKDEVIQTSTDLDHIRQVITHFLI